MSELEEAFARQVEWLKMPAPRREFAFHPTRRWRFDFAWPTLLIAVEVEGGTWITGGHSRGAGFDRDAVKYNEAALLGWLVLRVTGNMVDDGRAVEFLERALRVRSVGVQAALP